MSVLVTGGTKGIGLGVAQRFAQDGAHVLLGYATDDAAAEEARTLIETSGGSVGLIKADLSNPAGVDSFAEKVSAATSHLDQMVHGAVWPLQAATLDISPTQFAQAVWTNGSMILTLTQALRPLLSRGSSIYFLSSRGSKLAVPDYVAVGAPKALGEALVKYLSAALAPEGIRVNTIAVSTVLTEAIKSVRTDAEEYAAKMAARNPSGRNVTPDDVGALVFRLAQPELSMITGQEILVDGGIYSGSR